MSLQAQLHAIEQGMPPDKAGSIEAMIRRITADGAGETALKVGDQAPNFILSDAHGNATALRALLMEGPAVIVFYRGSWCPYCNAELSAYQLALPEITARGARLVAISPEKPDNSLTPSEIDALSFEVLSDPENDVARKFGLVYRLDEESRGILKSVGLDLEAINGDTNWELPVPATFIIDSNRKIVFASADPDFRKRADPADIVEALDRMAGQDG
jgi:peroxiredoxin